MDHRWATVLTSHFRALYFFIPLVLPNPVLGETDLHLPTSSWRWLPNNSLSCRIPCFGVTTGWAKWVWLSKILYLKLCSFSLLTLLLIDKILDFNVPKPHLREKASRVTDWLENDCVHSRIRHLDGVAVPCPALLLPICGCLLILMEWISAYLRQHRNKTQKTWQFNREYSTFGAHRILQGF